MPNSNPIMRKLGLGLLASGILTISAGGANAQALFGEPERLSGGRVSISAAEGFQPTYAGDEVRVSGQGFHPGQTVSVLYGRSLLASDLRADADGKFETRLRLPDQAAAGVHQIVVVSDAPYNAVLAELKVSPRIPLSGEGQYRVTTVAPAKGLYQTAYSRRNNALFATSAVGRPPVRESELIRLDADTLEVEARVTPAAAPAVQRQVQSVDGGVFAVYGVDVDDIHDTVWVTNARQDTIAVYRQSDLSLVRQYEPGVLPHGRDVIVDEARGKAFASAVSEPELVVFDTNSLEVVDHIPLQSAQWGETFTSGSLALDEEAGLLFVVSISTNEVAVINTATNAVERMLPVPGARSAIGVAYDRVTNRLFVAAQGSDNVVIIDATTGAVVADTPVGAGALNVAFEPIARRAYVSNFGAGTIAVLDPDGRLVANLPGAPVVNHASVDGRGNVYVAVKSGWRSDGPDTVQRLRLR